MAAQGADGNRAALQKVFSKLVEKLKSVDITDKLYESSLLSTEEYQGILQKSSKKSLN